MVKKKEVEGTEEIVEAELPEDFEVHIRLKKAQILKSPSLNIDLNALINKTSITLDKRKLSALDKQRLSTLVGSGDIEVYDPNLPQPINIPDYKLDLSDTPEFKFLNSGTTSEKLILSWIKNALMNPRASKIPLKVMYKLETTGQNKALKPRLNIVTKIVEALDALGIKEKDAELTPVEKDKLIDAIEQHTRNLSKGINATMVNESDEVLTSVQ